MNEPIVADVEKHGRIFNFELIKHYDVSDIKSIISRMEEEWRLDEWRQKMHDVHKHTESYMINKIDMKWMSIGDPMGYQKKASREDGELESLTLDIIEDLEQMFDGVAGFAMYIKLAAGEDVAQHQDYGDYFQYVHRIHIPIITNPDVVFMVGGENKYLQEGECWEINNRNTHYVKNPSQFDRIHLLVDIMEKKYIS